MFTYLTQEGKALEINTKSYQDYKGRTPQLDLDLLRRYKEMGGEFISLGSDSHDPERPGDKFGHYAELLKSLGFRWTAHYENRKPVCIAL
jgi:histidinol-phosphatase (PHP family)